MPVAARISGGASSRSPSSWAVVHSSSFGRPKNTRSAATAATATPTALTSRLVPPTNQSPSASSLALLAASLATKPKLDGRPAMEIPARTAAAAVTGMARRSPRRWSMMRVPATWSTLPATKNSGALYSACASRKAVKPTAPSSFGRPISRVSVPRAETVDQARMRFRSRSRSACTAAHTAVTVPSMVRVCVHQPTPPMASSKRAIT